MVTLSGDGIDSDADAMLLFDASDGGAVDHTAGSLVWTVTGSEAEIEAIIEGLLVDPDDAFVGTILVQMDVTTEETASVAGNPAPDGDGSNASHGFEFNEDDNIVVESFEFLVQVIDAPDPDIILAGGVDSFTVKEDGSASAITVQAQTDADSLLIELVISGLDDTWIYDFSGLETDGAVLLDDDPADGEIVVSLPDLESYDGSFLVQPPEDSDADLAALSVAVTAVDPDTLIEGEDTDSLIVVLDAVLDQTAAISQPEVMASQSDATQTIDLELEFSLVDAGFPGSDDGGADDDGSESVTSVEIQLSAGTLTFAEVPPEGVVLIDNGGSFTLTGFDDAQVLEAAIEAWAVEVPADFRDNITGTITTVT